MQMARLVLNNNCFAYEGKYYRQVRGGAMGSAFTQTLANIYILEWEHALVNHQQSSDELYGRCVLRAENRSIHSIRTETNCDFRYIDDIFMTSNLLPTPIEDLLRNASEKDPHIRISYIIRSSVEFLDVILVDVGYGALMFLTK